MALNPKIVVDGGIQHSGHTTHFEHEHMTGHLDDSFSHIGGHHGGGGHGGHHGGGGHGGHRGFGGIFYGGYPYVYPYGGGYGGRRLMISPLGMKWLGGKTGVLYGYPYNFLYPLFYDLSVGVYDEYTLKSRYSISDFDWNRLMLNLIQGGYISNYSY